MTVQEAVQLVIQAAAIGRDGEALVLDMGEPVRIADVAQQLVSQSPDPIEIVYTGLRPGEKLDEDLFGDDEVDERPIHPLISHVCVPPLDELQLRLLRQLSESDQTREALRRLVSEQDVRLSDPASASPAL